jgi:hypothetical protein
VNIKLTFNIEIDESEYPNLTKKMIREIVKQAEADGSILDYMEQQIKGALEVENFEKE